MVRWIAALIVINHFRGIVPAEWNELCYRLYPIGHSRRSVGGPIIRPISCSSSSLWSLARRRCQRAADFGFDFGIFLPIISHNCVRELHSNWRSEPHSIPSAIRGPRSQFQLQVALPHAASISHSMAFVKCIRSAHISKKAIDE